MKPAALYLRVSTGEQSVDTQKRQLEEWCRSNDYHPEYLYTDTMSGARRDRPALNQMLSDALAGKFKYVIVYKIDRLARSLVDFLNISKTLEDHGVALICPSQNIDTSDQSPCGKMQRAILAVVAEFERGLIKERVKAGIANAKANGVHCGRKSKFLAPDWGAKLAYWRHTEGGKDYRRLAQLLGGVSVSTAWRIAIQNPHL